MTLERCIMGMMEPCCLERFFTKEGKFPDIHIGDNKAMRERGIGCATSQDAQIRSKINPVKQLLKSQNHK